MKHQVTFDIPTRDLGKADIHFTVKVDGETLGKLEVSRGALVWYPKDTTYGHKVGWAQFNGLMKKYPKLERRKKK